MSEWRPFEPSREAAESAAFARYAKAPRPKVEERCPRGFFCVHEPLCPGAANTGRP